MAISQGERRLTAEQIATISDWVRDGAPEGSVGEIAAPPTFPDGWQLGKPDLVLEARGAVELPASGPDIYWNVIFTPNLTARRWVRAMEIRPGQPRVVHHANLLVDRAGSAHLQERAPGKGFPGMDLVIGRSPFDPDGNFLFWKPGGAPHVEPDGFAWRLDPGNELVLNRHLQPSGKNGRSAARHRPVFHRQAAEQVSRCWFNWKTIKRSTSRPASATFAISDDFRLPLDADVLAVYPHAHYLGKLLEA